MNYKKNTDDNKPYTTENGDDNNKTTLETYRTNLKTNNTATAKGCLQNSVWGTHCGMQTHDEKHVKQWDSIHKSINKTEVPTQQQIITGHAHMRHAPTVTLEGELLRYDTSA